MRIHFKNLGQAEHYLKTCKEMLGAALPATEGRRNPTQRLRNALCKGFGYSSYDELKSLLSGARLQAGDPPTPAELKAALEKAFSLALDVVCDTRFVPRQSLEPLTNRLALGVLGALEAGGYNSPDFDRATDYLSRGEYEQAVESLRRVAPEDRYYGRALSNMAVALIELGRYDEAVEAGRRALDVDPSLAKAYVLVARALKGALRYAEAADAFRVCVAREPASGEYLLELAACLIESGGAVEALSLATSVIERDPSSAEALFWAADAERELGHNDRAAELLGKARKLGNGDVDFLERVGISYQMLGDEESAAQVFRRVTRLDPQGGFAYYALIGIYGRLGMEEKSHEATLRAMDRGFRISPFVGEAQREAFLQHCIGRHLRRRIAMRRAAGMRKEG